ncbi:MAG: Ig-like domain repeat protein [Bacillota bacterium]|nr:Ig-like domain repeat protein [Bacillota bacterium]
MNKKMLQRITGIVIALTFMLGILPGYPSTKNHAAGLAGLDITHSDADGFLAPGETVTLSVSLSDYDDAADPVTALQVSVPLDPAIVEYVSCAVIATGNPNDIIGAGFNEATKQLEFIYASNSFDEAGDLLPLPVSNTTLLELTIRIRENLETDLVLTQAAGMYGDTTGLSYTILNILASPPEITLNDLEPSETPYVGDVSIAWNKGEGVLTVDGGKAIPITSGHLVSTSGDYEVTVTDAVGNSRTAAFRIISALHSPELSVTPGSGMTGQPLLLSASVMEGLSPYEYRFYVIGTEGIKETIQSYSADNTCNFVPAVAGIHTLGVEIRDSLGFEVNTETEVTVSAYVSPLGIAVFSAGDSDSCEPGQTIDLTAQGEGGTEPYYYHFYVLDLNGNRIDFQTNPDLSNTCSWTPDTAGTYTLGVDVYDTTGTKLTQEKTISVTAPVVPPLSIAVFRAGWSDTYELGQTINLAARGEGGTAPYRYQFYVLRSNGSRVNFRKTPVSSNIYPWTPVTADTYTLGVDIHDAAGNMVTEEKTITVTAPAAPPLSIAVFRAGWSDTYELGQTINLAARGEGGTAPYKYQFYVLRSNGSRVNFRKTPVSANIYPWTPVTADSYTLGVDVHDAAGNKVTEEKTITVTTPAVPPLSIAVFRAGWSDTYELGQTINLAARGEGGTAPYKYQFYVLRSNGSRVNFRKTPVSANIYPWTPVTPDSYTLGVDVYDAAGAKVTEEKTITIVPRP